MTLKRSISSGVSKNIPKGSTVVHYNRSKEEMYKKGLPKEIIHFLEYDSAAHFAYAQVYAVYRKFGKEATLNFIKDASRQEMIRSFGETHPCANA